MGNGVDYFAPRELPHALGAPIVITHGNLKITHMGDVAQDAPTDAAAQAQVGMMLKLLAKGEALPTPVTGAELSEFLSTVIAFGENAIDAPWFAHLMGVATKETNLRNALADAKALRDSISVSWFAPDSYSKGADPYDAAMKVAQRIYQEGVGAAATKTVLVRAQAQLTKDLTKPLATGSAFQMALAAFWKAYKVQIVIGGGALAVLIAAPYIARAVKGGRALRSIAGGG